MIRDEFAVHMLNEGGIAKAKALAEGFSTLLEAVEVFAGAEGRDVAIVRTKLQEASFFAKRAMACRKENQK